MTRSKFQSASHRQIKFALFALVDHDRNAFSRYDFYLLKVPEEPAENRPDVSGINVRASSASSTRRQKSGIKIIRAIEVGARAHKASRYSPCRSSLEASAMRESSVAATTSMTTM